MHGFHTTRPHRITTQRGNQHLLLRQSARKSLDFRLNLLTATKTTVAVAFAAAPLHAVPHVRLLRQGLPGGAARFAAGLTASVTARFLPPVRNPNPSVILASSSSVDRFPLAQIRSSLTLADATHCLAACNSGSWGTPSSTSGPCRNRRLKHGVLDL
ncbi:hypothetical protein U1Q18_040849 [Sarracenia purpurea var. burkii]